MGSVTIGANSYDIYGTQAEATIYLAAKIGQTEWTAASADAQAQALVTATRLIEPWLAARGFTEDPATSTDVNIEQATYELAYALVVSPSLQGASNQNGNRRRVKAGSAEVEYFRPEKGGRFPVQVQALLNAFIDGEGGSSFSGAPVSSGTCETSTLDADDYGLNRGY